MWYVFFDNGNLATEVRTEAEAKELAEIIGGYYA